MVFQRLFDVMERPLRLAVLETPAGFELNSAWVAGQVATFLEKRFPNLDLEVTVVPARKRGTDFSPDAPGVVAPLFSANVIYLGAGSPTYAVRQLEGSLAWHILAARHRLGAGVAAASAGTLAIGALTLPVYEVFKVGEDVHWKPGLDLLGPFGLSVVWVPHWNNTDGGANLDTSRCFMGESRFAELLGLLPAGMVVIGIEEHTGALLDLQAGTCQVLGRGGVIVLREGQEKRFERGRSFAIEELGAFSLPEPSGDLPAEVWRRVVAAEADRKTVIAVDPPPEVLALLEQRRLARTRRDWRAADRVRDQILMLGWHIRDTPSGPELVPLEDSPEL